MARVSVALGVLVACLSYPSIGLAQECTCCGCDKVDLSLPPQEPDPALLNGPSQAELEGALAGGITALAASYVLGVAVAWHEQHPNAVVDRIPIIGPVYSAARNANDDQDVPLLLFSAGVQAMSVMLIAAAASDLAALHRIQVAIGASPDGCGVSLTGRFP